MTQTQRGKEKGSMKSWMITSIGLIFLLIVAIVFAGWFFMQYTDQKTNVDAKVNGAVLIAKKVQADADEKKFFEQEKEPYREFVGPEDYGRVTFNYPKTWSVYVSADANKGGTFSAYLNPKTVPLVSPTQQFAIRVTIEQKDYAQVIASYDTLVRKGDLKASSVKANGNDGTRLDGSFTKDIRGFAVIYKIRDKTLTIRSDANTFLSDFNKLIETIKFKV